MGHDDVRAWAAERELANVQRRHFARLLTAFTKERVDLHRHTERGGHFEDRERVVSKVFKSHVAYLAVQVHGFVDPSARAHDFSQVIEGK